MAPDGRCKTLDSSANGYVRAEACIVIKLERVVSTAAEGSSNTAMALLVAGTAVNQDGRSSSLTAPHGPSQQAVIAEACTAATILPATLSAVEMHGTGTALGDPIEVGALAAVLVAPHHKTLDLTAGKSLYGHGETAAGVMGVCRVVLRLSRHLRTPILHLASINAYVGGVMEDMQRNLGAAALTAARQGGPGLPAESGATIMGVSAFAFQGTNAHAVLRATSAGSPVQLRTAVPGAMKRTRYWFAPAPHQLLCSTSTGGSIARFDAALGRPALSYLYEHQASWSKVHLPGGGFALNTVFVHVHGKVVQPLVFCCRCKDAC
jgi:acyl transferase domain-containing protein